MSIEITGVTIAHRKKTAAEWADSEYVLAEAEWGYETDTGKAKIGDGVTPWDSLDYFGGGAGGVTLKPWTPATYVEQGIDLVTPISFVGNTLTTTLTGSTVSVTGNEDRLANGLVSAAGVLSTTQANNLYFKMGASAGAELIDSTYIGFVDAASVFFDNLVYSKVILTSPVTTMALDSLGNLMGGDSTGYSPVLEIPTSSINSEICLSYMPVGGTNGFGYVTLYIDGIEIAQHQFTQAVPVDRVIVSTYATWEEGDPSNSAWVECLNNPVYPIAGLPPLFIGESTKLDETAYPANATSNIFEITGTATPIQWDELGGTVVNGDLVAFDSAGAPFVVDVTETDLSGYIAKPAGFDEIEGDEYKYISGKGTLKDVSTIQKLGNMPNVVFSTENAEVGGNPIGFDALVILDKATWGFGLVTNLAETQVENSLIVLTVEDTVYQLGSTIYIPSEGGVQALNKCIANRGSGSGIHNNSTYIEATSYNAQNIAGIGVVCEWDATTKAEISRAVHFEGETIVWRNDDNGTLPSTMSRLVQTIPATPTSAGKLGQLAADADYLYYCYAADSWASIPKNTFKTPFGSTINWLTVSTPTFSIEPEHAGISLWVTVDCVITVTAHSTLPTGFNCEIFKADSSLIVSVVTSGSDTIRDSKSVIVSDASVFKSPSAGVIGLVGDAS